MCMKCSWDRPVKEMATKIIVNWLGEHADRWLWDETPFPADLPTWPQLFKAVKGLITTPKPINEK